MPRLEDAVTYFVLPAAEKLREPGLRVIVFAPAFCVTVTFAVRPSVVLYKLTRPVLSAPVFAVQLILKLELLIFEALSQPLLLVVKSHETVAETETVLLPAAAVGESEAGLTLRDPWISSPNSSAPIAVGAKNWNIRKQANVNPRARFRILCFMMYKCSFHNFVTADIRKRK